MHRGDVIGLATVGGGVAGVVEVGVPVNQDEASTIYTVRGDVTALQRGATVVGVLSADRGLPSLEAVSAADGRSYSHRPLCLSVCVCSALT